MLRIFHVLKKRIKIRGCCCVASIIYLQSCSCGRPRNRVWFVSGKGQRTRRWTRSVGHGNPQFALYCRDLGAHPWHPTLRTDRSRMKRARNICPAGPAGLAKTRIIFAEERTGVFHFRRSFYARVCERVSASECMWDLPGKAPRMRELAAAFAHCAIEARGPFGVRVKKNEQGGNESSWFSGDRQTARQTD